MHKNIRTRCSFVGPHWVLDDEDLRRKIEQDSAMDYTSIKEFKLRSLWKDDGKWMSIPKQQLIHNTNMINHVGIAVIT